MESDSVFVKIVKCFSDSNSLLLDIIIILRTTELLEGDKKRIKKYTKILEEKIIEINDLIK